MLNQSSQKLKRIEHCKEAVRPDVLIAIGIFFRCVHMVKVPWQVTTCSLRKVLCQVSQWGDNNNNNNNVWMCIWIQVILYTVDTIMASLPPMWRSLYQKKCGNKWALSMTRPPNDKRRQQTCILKIYKWVITYSCGNQCVTSSCTWLHF